MAVGETSVDTGALEIEQKRSLLAKLLQESTSDSATNLTQMQSRWWFLHRLDPTVPYHVQRVALLNGRPDQAAVLQATADLLTRHDAARTTYPDVGGHALSVQSPIAAPEVAGISLAPSDALGEALAAACRVDFWRPFDLSRGPQSRVSVVDLAETGHDAFALVLTLHRICSDDSSADACLRTLVSAYRELSGTAADPPDTRDEDATKFVDLDVVAAAEASLDVPGLQEWWRSHLADVSPLSLPTDGPRLARKTFQGAGAACRVSPDLLHAIDDLAAQTDTDTGTVVLASLALVLARTASTGRFAIGTTIRRDAGVGPLDNEVPVVVDVPGVTDLVGHVRAVAAARAASLAHGELPFPQIIDSLVHQSRDRSLTPVFQVFFDDRPARRLPDDIDALLLPGAHEPEPYAVDARFARLDLMVTWSRDGELTVQLPAATHGDVDARRLADRLVSVLQAAANTPELLARDIPLVSEEEWQAQLAWGRGEPLDSAEACLHDLVLAQANRTPAAAAVRCGEERLSFAELADQASRVAAALISAGCRPGDPVLLAVRRDVASVVGLLGVLLSGGCYVPVDARQAPRRAGRIANDSGATVWLGDADDLAGLDDGLTPPVRVDLASARRGSTSAAALADVSPDHPAYLIYTSGSTGVPKGVTVPHRQIVASTRARVMRAMGGEAERYLVMAPLTFDAAGAGIFLCLCYGGEVVLPTADEALDPGSLAKLVTRAEITHFNSVPSQYATLLEREPDCLSGAHAVIVAGEALPRSLAESHHRHLPAVPLFNEYGPTETTIWATATQVGPADVAWEHVPIGSPVPGVTTLVLDRGRRPLPEGAAGELLISGAGVARGYHGRPRETAELFVPHPWGAPGERMYATGDRVRWTPDGRLQFLSRMDTQVKIRGFRIEPGEVEAAIMRQATVRDAAVGVRVRADGGATLIAHIVPQGGHAFSARALQAALLAELPDYMVPSEILTIPAMPTTPHGKIDRRALPDPQSPTIATLESMNEHQQLVADLFAQVLDRGVVGLDDSFFDLGGDSLLVAKFLARLVRELSVELDVDQFFAVPSVRGIAQRIDEVNRLHSGDLDELTVFNREIATLHEEVHLDPEVVPEDVPRGKFFDPDHILLTGATGYIGSFVLIELIARTDATIHCLVRGEDDASARERLRSTLQGFRSWDASLEDRIEIVRGDLARPRLGLDDDSWERLARTIDTIHHVGAQVNFTYPYQALRRPNVDGTVELLKLACTRQIKAFHFVSTMDVYLGFGAPRPFLEDDLTEDVFDIPSGYPRTKYVAEKIVCLARDRGLPVSILRPWQVIGHSETGAVHTTDYIFIAVKGFMELGGLPTYTDIVNAVPVDFFARAQVQITHDPRCLGRTFNIGNIAPPVGDDLYAWLHSYGYRTDIVEREEMRARALKAPPDSTIFPLTSLLRTGHPLAQLAPEVQRAIDPMVECRNVVELLDGTDVVCPPIDQQHAHRILDFLVETGFLPPPDQHEAIYAP